MTLEIEFEKNQNEVNNTLQIKSNRRFAESGMRRVAGNVLLDDNVLC